MEKRPQSFDVCIVCALYEEAEAVLNEFSIRCNVSFIKEFSSIDRYEYRYASILNNREEPLTVLVTWLSDSGPIQTGLDLKPFLYEFRPRFVAMTGFCAGYKKEVTLGDLIVAQYAYFYEAGKTISESEGLSSHLQEMKVAASTSQVLQYARGFDGWKKPMKRMKSDKMKRQLRDTEEPRCFIAPIASGMAVRQDDPFPWLRKTYDRNTIGLDMESATFYQASRAISHIHALVVKGVCDYADMSKKDTYHNYAARASAVYLLSFIQEYVTEHTMPRIDTPPFSNQIGLSNTGNPSITIVNISVDNGGCDWYRVPDSNTFAYERPLYRRFMLIDKVVVHFQRLRPEMQDVFKITLNILQDRLSKIENSPASKILSEHVQVFRQLDAPTFYKSLVLMNRFPSLLKSSAKVYIVRKNDLGDLSRYLLPELYDYLFSQEGYSSVFEVNKNYNLLTDINDDFYMYDIASVKAVHELLSLIWPEHDEYINIIKIKSIEGAFKTFRRFFMRTTAPVFDITLINNTQTTQVIHQMDVVIEKVWSEAKGLPKPEILRPIATYRFTLDFTKKVNSFSLDPQIAFGTEQPVRFQIQLDDFMKNVRGNMAIIHFSFVCNGSAVESKSLLLDF